MGYKGALTNPDGVVETFPGVARLLELAPNEELVSRFGYKP